MSGSTDVELPTGMHIEGNPSEEPEAGERQLTPREIAMAAIAAKAHERMEAELAQSAVYDQDARDAGLAFAVDEPEPAAVDPDPVPVAAQPKAPEPAPAAVPTPALRTVDVDGQQWQVTDEQFVQLARMGAIANTALHQYQQRPPEQPQQVQGVPLVDPDRVRQTAKAIQYGNEDEAAAALTQLIADVTARVPQQVNTDAIVRRAVTEAQQQAALERDASVIKQEFADIFEHPQRTFLAKVNVDAIRHRNTAIGRQQSDIEVYREAGNMVRSAMGMPAPGNDPSPAQGSGPAVIRSDVIERKRAAPRPTQAIDRRAPAPEATRAPTGSEIVDRMRTQRGQASMR